MNILVSSTRQWNPGDEFIFFGVQNLLKEALKGQRINWILYDRNPDLFIDGFNNPVHKEKIWGNSFHHEDQQLVRFIGLMPNLYHVLSPSVLGEDDIGQKGGVRTPEDAIQ